MHNAQLNTNHNQLMDIYLIFSESHHLLLIFSDPGGSEEYTLCGNSIPQPIIADQFHLSLRMKVDNNNAQYKGYAINFECLPSQCLDDTIEVQPEDPQSGSTNSHYDYPGPYTKSLDWCSNFDLYCHKEDYRYA